MRIAIPVAIVSMQHDRATQIAIDAQAAFDAHAARIGSLTKDGKSCIACARGCSHCCNLQVTASMSELLLIAAYLGTWSSSARTEITAKLALACEMVKGKGSKERAELRVSCPLLGDGGECSIYSVRPTACRAYVSFDVGACRTGMAVPRSKQLEQARDELLCQLLNCEHELGLEARTFELIQGLHLLLAAPNNIGMAADGYPVLSSINTLP